MRQLYIIRHGKSDWNDSFLSDYDRPLNKRGEKNAPFMGDILAQNGALPDLILSSPATRAKMTAEAIAEKVHYDTNKILYKEDLYLADIDDIIEVVRGIPASKKRVFIVGHNPGLTQFAEYISGYVIDNIPTCGIFCVTLKEDDWKRVTRESADFVSFDYPKRYQ